MADAATMRSTVETLMTRLLAGGKTELAEQLVHPDFVNNEADPERRNGPSGAAATSEWLRSCFGKLRYDIHPPGLQRRRHGCCVRDDARDARRRPSARRGDDLGMVVQLGLLPLPSAAGEGSPPS